MQYPSNLGTGQNDRKRSRCSLSPLWILLKFRLKKHLESPLYLQKVRCSLSSLFLKLNSDFFTTWISGIRRKPKYKSPLCVTYLHTSQKQHKTRIWVPRFCAVSKFDGSLNTIGAKIDDYSTDTLPLLLLKAVALTEHVFWVFQQNCENETAKTPHSRYHVSLCAAQKPPILFFFKKKILDKMELILTHVFLSSAQSLYFINKCLLRLP